MTSANRVRDAAPQFNGATARARPCHVRFRRWLKHGTLAGFGLLLILVLAGAVLGYLFPYPTERLDRVLASPVVLDRHGRTMLEVVAADDQWHIPVRLQEISPWLIQATIAVEDERFYSHFGVDPIAVGRAAWQDIRARRIVSGASTLTMQIQRLLENRPRRWATKLCEAFRALQLERVRDKRSILETYLNLAPYGGNLRGVEAAARAYFGKHAGDLSLGEAATLAGLPQAPTRFRPDRHPAAAAARRETVLRRMTEVGSITQGQRNAAASEPINLKPCIRRTRAPHAAWLALCQRPRGGRTCIDLEVQDEVEHLAGAHAQSLPAHPELAVVVIEVSSGDVVALVGSKDFSGPQHGQVNGAVARRSPGSTLKPFIYAAAFETRRMTPDSIVYDIQIRRAGWEPSNFDRSFAGELPVSEALRRSLNVPAILVAEGVGLSSCSALIESVGIRLPASSKAQSGLALVVGASEVTLLDLTNAYATIGRGGVRQRARLFLDEPIDSVRVMDGNVCATLDDILSCRRRVAHDADSAGELPWFMWKTGTSSGRRDAWAVGHNRRYAIGVWVGDFPGRGSVDLVGGSVAEPLLAALFYSPMLRASGEPPPPAAWIVSRPLSPPTEVASSLRIAAPADGAKFLTINGRAIVVPRISAIAPAEISDDLIWFLNGVMLAAGQAERLELKPGRYELRCVTRAGQSAATVFSVR